MQKYKTELILGLATITKNAVLVAACAWTVVSLYELSGSWHSLWALAMLGFLTSYKFKRD